MYAYVCVCVRARVCANVRPYASVFERQIDRKTDRDRERGKKTRDR